MNAAINPRLVIIPRYGLGQTGDAATALADPTDLGWTTTSVPAYTGVSLATTPAATAPGTPIGPQFSWTSFLNNLIGQAGATARASIAPLSVLPPGSSYFSSPYG